MTFVDICAKNFRLPLCFLHREGISGPGITQVIPGEWQDQRTGVQTKRAGDVRRTFYKAVSRSSFRVEAKFRLPFPSGTE